MPSENSYLLIQCAMVCAILLLLIILAAVLIEQFRKKATLEAQRSSVNMSNKKGQSCENAASRLNPTQMINELPNESSRRSSDPAICESSVRSRWKSSCIVRSALSVDAPVAPLLSTFRLPALTSCKPAEAQARRSAYKQSRKTQIQTQRSSFNSFGN